MNVEVNNAEYKIMIVDDVLSNIMLLKILLTSEKYQIMSAMGGKEALEKIQVEKPDLLLLDVMMPDMDGYEVTTVIRAMDSPLRDIPIIFLTALNSTADVVKGFQVGETILSPSHSAARNCSFESITRYPLKLPSASFYVKPKNCAVPSMPGTRCILSLHTICALRLVPSK